MSEVPLHGTLATERMFFWQLPVRSNLATDARARFSPSTLSTKPILLLHVSCLSGNGPKASQSRLTLWQDGRVGMGRCMRGWRWRRERESSLSTPYTLHPTPYNLHPTPYTLHPAPCTLHPTPFTPHPSPYTLHLNVSRRGVWGWGALRPTVGNTVGISTSFSAYYPMRKWMLKEGASPGGAPGDGALHAGVALVGCIYIYTYM